MITVSVVTCVFNQRLDYFSECVDSVLCQPGPIEWIVVDDGSDPYYHEAYGDLIARTGLYHRCELIRLPENVGLSRARNEALRHVRGEWVIVLDSDDRLSSDLSDKLRSLSEDAALACFEVNFFRNEEMEHRPISRWRDLYRQYGRTVADPFLWFDFYYHGVVARLELLRRIGFYNDAIEVGEDQDILFRACEAVGIENVFFCDEIGYFYRDNPEGICATRWQEVERNYCSTMIEAARRRGADFRGCRLAGTCNIDGAEIDAYEYFSGKNWLTWDQYILEHSLGKSAAFVDIDRRS